MLYPSALLHRPVELAEVPGGGSETLLVNGWAESLFQQQLRRPNLVSPYHLYMIFPTCRVSDALNVVFFVYAEELKSFMMVS